VPDPLAPYATMAYVREHRSPAPPTQELDLPAAHARRVPRRRGASRRAPGSSRAAHGPWRWPRCRAANQVRAAEVVIRNGMTLRQTEAMNTAYPSARCARWRSSRTEHADHDGSW